MRRVCRARDHVVIFVCFSCEVFLRSDSVCHVCHSDALCALNVTSASTKLYSRLSSDWTRCITNQSQINQIHTPTTCISILYCNEMKP